MLKMLTTEEIRERHLQLVPPSMKRCLTCDEVKPQEAFGFRNKLRNDLRLQTDCRKCNSKRGSLSHLKKRLREVQAQLVTS